MALAGVLCIFAKTYSLLQVYHEDNGFYSKLPYFKRMPQVSVADSKLPAPTPYHFDISTEDRISGSLCVHIFPHLPDSPIFQLNNEAVIIFIKIPVGDPGLESLLYNYGVSVRIDITDFEIDLFLKDFAKTGGDKLHDRLFADHVARAVAGNGRCVAFGRDPFESVIEQFRDPLKVTFGKGLP
jgi:hypothetical protein